MAVLGTGIMGSGIALNLVDGGFDVRVWNRTAEHAAPVVAAGATRAATPREAVTDADVVITMLFDAAVTIHVMDQCLEAINDDLWIQAGTVGIEGIAELSAAAREFGVTMIDAPVLGTRRPAQEGTLTVLAAGTMSERERATRVFDTYAEKTIWVADSPGAASSLKLACNSWVLMVTAGVAQALALCESSGLDARLFLEAIAGGTLDLAYAHAKGSAMMRGDYAPSFEVAGAVKDLSLILTQAHENGVSAEIVAALHHTFRTTADAGHSEDDIAAVYDALLPDTPQTP
ncbi:NAD(P)-dependent oxidoreductase [Spiractinospora alimapuensis]|nr:NAD(P)-dependent oxidoreductase [Spiractinospora alimapuensis]